MVLEHLFPDDWLERRGRYAFILAFVYATIGILAARLLFASNSGIVSVFFTALLLLPYMGKLLLREERRELREKRFTFAHLWHDNKEAYKVYLVVFLGIYLAFAGYSFALGFTGESASVFGEQLAPEMGGGRAAAAGAASAPAALAYIASNNWWVLLACFLLALLAGDAAIFFVAWNASAWGSIFGFRAVEAGAGAFDPWLNLIIILAITLPHVLLEGSAYILAAISGGVLSDDIIQKRSVMTHFFAYLLGTVAAFILLHNVAAHLLAGAGLVLSVVDMAFVLLALHFMVHLFPDAKTREVFQYNYALFLIAIGVYVLGVVVEVAVLTNATILSTIYEAARLRF